MISVEEKTTKKVPGRTSLFVSFEYNKEIVNFMRSVDGAAYDKKTQLWEIPVSQAKILLTGLCAFDSVCVKTLLDQEQPQHKFELGPFKTKPYQYQIDGIEYGLNHPQWLLLDEPGLGKSLSAICIAETLKRYGEIKNCLIICGINTLKTNWKSEVEKHSNLSCRILGQRERTNGKAYIGSVQDRIDDLKYPIKEFFAITNIETLRSEDVIKQINSGVNHFDMIVVDEIHTCKNPQSQQGKNLLKLKAPYMLGMTGTLLLNDPLDCYVPLKWIGAERSTYTNFKYFYCNFGGPFHNIPMGYKHIDVLKDQIQQVSLRRTKDLLDLPEKTVIDEIVDLSEEHRAFYDAVKNGVVEQVDKVHISTANLLSMVSRLRQATVLPQILTSDNIESSKINRAIQLVDEIVNNGNKVVIFSTYKESAKYIYNKLIKYNPLLCTGDQKDFEISISKDIFQEDSTHKVMVATWQKMGTGLTLNAANYAIFLDTPWTSGTYIQAQDRVHRIGSKKPVFIYNLICKDTIDERVHQIVTQKWALSNYVVDDDTSEEVLNSLREYIKELQ